MSLASMGRVLGIITARGGSQGLPGKNILPFAGKPLIAHTILAAKAAGQALHRLILSTDTEEIAEVGRQWGAEVPFLRPAELARPETSSLDTVLHCLEQVEADEGCQYDWVLLLQPTSPLRNSEDIERAVELAGAPDTSSVISVTEANECHPLLLKTIEDGRLRAFLRGAAEPDRRQDLSPAVYWLDGAIYLTRRETLVRDRNFYGPSPRAYVMPRDRSIDIDDALDFAMAEFLWRRLNLEGEVH